MTYPSLLAARHGDQPKKTLDSTWARLLSAAPEAPQELATAAWTESTKHGVACSSVKAIPLWQRCRSLRLGLIRGRM